MYPSRRSKLPLDQFIAMSNSVFIEKKNSTHRKAIVNDNSHGVRIGGEDGSNHHQIDEHASEVSQRSGWLRHDHNGVHHCVHHAASGKQTEVEHSAGYGRAGPNVDQADEEEWHDVFHIVEMRPSNSFDRFVRSYLNILYTIFRIDEYFLCVTMKTCQE